ncbi:MAG: hypothetical protein Q4F05_02455 [bacterium]|nr:hypothetical protein [bacterium]
MNNEKGGYPIDMYTFFFDESFHDRVIRINENGDFNTLRNEALDNYIGVFWGCKNSELISNRNIIRKFEDRQKKRYGLSDDQELKSTTIGKKNFIYGIRSFNKNTMEFYTEFFTMLDALNPVLQINMVSKMELYLRSALRGLEYLGHGRLLENSFYYSLTKFMLTYHNEELVKTLYDVHDYKSMIEFKEKLEYNFECILDATKEIVRKEKEIEAFKNILYILKESQINELPEREYGFQYTINFGGLCNLLEEKHIRSEDVSLVIDEEKRTYEAAKKFDFQDVRCGKSDKILELRVSDWLATFIGRMIYGLYHDRDIEEDHVTDIRKVYENDLERKRILSKDWFDINEAQFNLYHLLYEVLIIGHTEYWTCMTLSYGDQSSVFYTLIRYFSGYTDFEQYQKVDAKLHSEYFNSSCCVELERAYCNFYKV